MGSRSTTQICGLLLIMRRREFSGRAIEIYGILTIDPHFGLLATDFYGTARRNQ